MPHCQKFASMRPSAFYMRAALRKAKSTTELRAIGLHCVLEYERLREWVRGQGLIPPKFEVLESEGEAKGMCHHADTDLPDCDDCTGPL